MIVDKDVEDSSTLLFVGSYNISKESYNCDDEQLIIVYSKELAEKAFGRFEWFKEKSILITKELMDSLSFKKSLLLGKIFEIILRRFNN